MNNPLPKGTKARLKRIAWSADKALEFLHKAAGEAYNLPEYNAMLQNVIPLVAQIHTVAKNDAKAADPENPPIVEEAKP